jgi:lipid-A-disaccharide synthase
MKNDPSLLVIAGEVSGDMHAASLLHAIKSITPGVKCFGVGGDRLREEGAEILYHASDMAALGFAEVIPKLSFFRRVFRNLAREAAERRPDAVLLVDYPGFNLRFAEHAHKLGLKVIYYICPQVWAWHRSRIPKMAEVIDRLIAIFPFEPDVFAQTGLRVDYVGHPLVDEAARIDPVGARDIPWQSDARIALLPGSRRQEILRILPSFCRAAQIIAKTRPEADFIVAAPSDGVAEVVKSCLARFKAPRFAVVVGRTRHVLRSASAALVASGTATLEAALMKCPMVVSYKVAPLNYFFLSRLVSTPHIGMVNIVAGARICPELVQNEATPQALARHLMPLIDDSAARRQMILAFEGFAARLGPSGSHERAARIVLDEIG